MLPASDLSEYFRSEPLLHAWYALRGANIGAVVDTVKPRVRALMAMGRHGTLQDLLYDTDGWQQAAGLWGIVPSFTIDGQRYWPFRRDPRSFETNRPEGTSLDPKRNTVTLSQIRTYSENGTLGPPMDLSMAVEDDAISVQVECSTDCEHTEVLVTLYPLYSHFTPAGGQERLVEYYRDGYAAYYSQGFEESVGPGVCLRDRLCRMPVLRASVSEGELWLRSGTDEHRGNAHRLHLHAVASGPKQALRLELEPNPLVMYGPPGRDAGWNELRFAGTARPTVTVDGREAVVTDLGEGQFRAYVDLSDGQHVVEARLQEATLRRTLNVLGGFEEKVVRMGRAALQLPWKDGPVAGIMPYFNRLDPIEPLPRVGYAHISHSLRAFPIIAAAALLSGDRSFLERGMEYIRKHVALCRQYENGDRMTPLAFDFEGKPGYVKSARPSDQGIMVRALLHLDAANRFYGDEEEARWCRETATSFAQSLLRLQDESGGFYPRYDFNTLEPQKDAERRGTVNNWAIQVWELAERLERLDGQGERAEGLRTMIERYVDFLLFHYQPTLLEVAGGGEDMPNYYSALATASSYLAMKYLRTGDERYRDYAEQAWKMAAWTCMHYVDLPAAFFYPGEFHGGVYSNQPAGLLVMGGMQDKTVLEAGLFLDSYLGFPLGAKFAAYNFADVVGELLLDNGGLYTFHVNVPNYRYDRLEGHPLTYAGVGIFASRWAHDHIGSGWRVGAESAVSTVGEE
ncbi:MAG: hypothetical protein ACOYEW_13125 [Anaerolineae bacterium]|jgi:hypothetical protein